MLNRKQATPPHCDLLLPFVHPCSSGIVRDNAGHCVALKWTMDAIYNVDDDSIYWAASDIGVEEQGQWAVV